VRAIKEEAGIHPLVVKNLQKQLSIASPTECQSSSIPLLAQNLDVVIAAETGSGKTYAYAISIVSDVLKRKEIERREEVSALIMCPNAHLCDQVKKAIDILTLPDDDDDDDDGDNGDKPPLVRTVALTPDRGLPSSFPDIIVCTPARAEQDVFDWREGSWRNGAFSPYVKFIRTVVLDEADMLLGGGYARKVRNCFDVLFREEKLAATRGFYKTFEDESEITNKTRTKETLTSEWKNDLDRDAEASMEQNWRKDHDFDDDDFDDDDFDDEKNKHEYEYEREQNDAKKKKKKPKARLGGKGRKGKGTNREFRRQYVFAAATVMSTGKRTPGAVLKFGFPDAVWTKSASLHKPRAELTQTWREVTLETRAKALFEALNMDPKTAHVEKTLVFVNSGSACEAISSELESFGAKVVSFHSDIDPLERDARLRRFAMQDQSDSQTVDVLVATDSVARGVDIPNVKHVVQAEFAQNATEYLHRVGRTARAGKRGRATNIILPRDFDLAAAIRDAASDRRSVEDTFSRKRSFRNKFKKYGPARRRKEAEE